MLCGVKFDKFVIIANSVQQFTKKKATKCITKQILLPEGKK